MRFASDALPVAVLGSRRLLSLAGDDALVAQMRRGNEAAFEVAFDRYGAQILGFCRHMLGSTEEAEDAVQHTFAAAFRDLGLHAERTVALKPWLYTIARNRCVSVLRARHEQSAVPHEPSTIALAEQVERRAEVQELLEDMLELPEDQRAALLLSQGGALSHAEVAGVLGCETAQVKGLVFRARTALIQRREARDTPCATIREQLASLRGGALRRTELRHHLRECAGCRAFREHVRQQRRLLGAALPMAPSVALKASVLGGTTGGGGGLAAAIGGGTLTKAAVACVLAGGGTVVVVEAERETAPPVREPAAVTAPSRAATRAPATTTAPETRPVPIAARPSGRSAGAARAVERRAAGGGVADRRAAGRSRAAERRRAAEPAARPRGSRPAAGPKPAKARAPAEARGRGPVAAPLASTPVRRGPPVPKAKAALPAKANPKAAAPGPPAKPVATKPEKTEKH